MAALAGLYREAAEPFFRRRQDEVLRQVALGDVGLEADPVDGGIVGDISRDVFGTLAVPDDR